MWEGVGNATDIAYNTLVGVGGCVYGRVGWDGSECDELGCDRLSDWDGRVPSRIVWARVEWSELGWVRHELGEVRRGEARWAGVDWTGMVWSGLV